MRTLNCLKLELQGVIFPDVRERSELRFTAKVVCALQPPGRLPSDLLRCD